MTTLLKRPQSRRRDAMPADGAVMSAELGADLDRIECSEQIERNR